jgi:hypothetical protein
MRREIAVALSALAAAGLFAYTAIAKEDAGAPADSPALKNFERTGEFETCLPSNRINYSRILNKRQILFEMTGGEVYLNEPNACPGLSTSYALVYTANPNHLCNTTVVRLIEPGSPAPERGGCGLSRFEKLKKKTVTE